MWQAKKLFTDQQRSSIGAERERERDREPEAVLIIIYLCNFLLLYRNQYACCSFYLYELRRVFSSAADLCPSLLSFALVYIAVPYLEGNPELVPPLDDKGLDGDLIFGEKLAAPTNKSNFLVWGVPCSH